MSLSSEQYAALKQGDVVVHKSGKQYQVWQREPGKRPWFQRLKDGKLFGPGTYRFGADKLVSVVNAS